MDKGIRKGRAVLVLWGFGDLLERGAVGQGARRGTTTRGAARAETGRTRRRRQQQQWHGRVGAVRGDVRHRIRHGHSGIYQERFVVLSHSGVSTHCLWYRLI